MMEEEWQGRPSIAPLLARLERLDLLIKSVEKRQDLKGADPSGDEARRRVSLDSAVEEAREKGSVLGRLSSIERRLTQLSLQVETNNAASNSSALGSPSRQASSSNNNYPLSFHSLDGKLHTQQKDHKQHGHSRSTANKHVSAGEVSQKLAVDISSTTSRQDAGKKDHSNKVKMRNHKPKTRNSSWCKRLLGC